MNATCTPYQKYDWLKPWCDHVAPTIGAEPRIVLGYTSDDKLVFILPFMLTRQFGITTCQWLGGKVQNINAGLYDSDWLAQCDEKCFDEILMLIKSTFKQIDVFDFSYNPPDLYGYKNPFLKNRFTTKSIHLLFKKNFVRYKKNGETTVFSGKKARRNSKRLRQLESQFENVRVKTCNSDAENAKALDAFYAFSAARFSAKGIANDFSTDEMRVFLKSVSANETLLFNTIDAGQATIAVLGYLGSENYWSGFIQSVDTKTVTKGSPGKVLIHSFIENAYSNRADSIDIGLGKEPYKEAHFDAVQMHDALIANSMKGNFAVIYLRVKRGFMRMIRNSDFMWSLVVKFRKMKRLRI